MIHTISSIDVQNVRKKIVLPDKREHWQTDYMGPEASSNENGGLDDTPIVNRSPQAALIEKPPGSIVPPHFHCVNQFQVVVDGTGAIGRHAIRSGSVHYSGAYTGYGPIIAGKSGISYFTLRAQFDFGAYYLPASKAKLKNVEREFVVTDDIDLLDPNLPSLNHEATLTTLIEPRASGLAGYLARIGGGMTLRIPRSEAAGGQYWVVMTGGLSLNNRDHPRLSCVYVSADDETPLMEAGPLGANVIVVQFPGNPEPYTKISKVSRESSPSISE
ncbi:MAG: hypothetical protein AMXMBFR6_22080 [Betaproteobacteria bacterium]